MSGFRGRPGDDEVMTPEFVRVLSEFHDERGHAADSCQECEKCQGHVEGARALHRLRRAVWGAQP